jgi:hypothetical protein
MEAPRRNIHYKDCFSGPAGINSALGFFLGLLLGIILGLIAAALVPLSLAPVAGAAVWIGCTVLFTILFRTRRFDVLLRAEGLDVVGKRAIAYDDVRFIDAGARVDTFKGGAWTNARVRITGADGRTTRIGIDRGRAATLMAELRLRCPRAGGIDLDESDWLPASSPEARTRLRKILLLRALLGLALGGGWLLILGVMAALVASDYRRSSAGDRLHDWSQLAIASMAIPFALRTLKRGMRAWARRKAWALSTRR